MSNTIIHLNWVNSVPVPALAEFARRRENLFAVLPEQSAVIILSAAEVLRNGDDNTFTYRQNSDLLYLSGFVEAGSALVLTKKQGKCRFLMFVNRQDRHSEIWHGKRVGLEGAVRDFGADRAFSITTFGGTLPRILKGVKNVFVAEGGDTALIKKAQSVLTAHGLKSKSCSEMLSEQRLIKSPTELAIMQHSASIAAAAHTNAMANCSAASAECGLKAMIEFVFTANGNACPSYDTIVANGSNGLSLHHPAGTHALRDGDMVLVDAGCEVSGYASDITRTYPVNGKFSAAQKEIYELVLASQLAAIEAVKPGATWSDLDKACNDVLTAGLKTLGFHLGAKSQRALKLEDLMPHSLGHWLGLDVHDVGNDRIKIRGANGRLKKQERPLIPGMVLTIEPGLYLSLTDKRIPEAYRGIAVRIEDDIAVTADGHIVLTREVVKTVSEIEELMRAF